MSHQRNNLVYLLEDCATATPDQVLYILNHKEITAGEIKDQVFRLYASLQSMGIQRGSRVLLMLPNIPEYVMAYYAILCAGAVVVPINDALREREIHYLMEDCEARAIIAGESNAQDVLSAARSLVTLRHVILHGNQIPPEALKLGGLIGSEPSPMPPTEVSAEDTAVILYTAGTTGRPKGAEISHFSLMGNARLCVDLLQMRSKDRLLGALPFFHAFGQTAVMNAALTAGASAVLVPDFDVDATMKAVQDHKISIFLGTPSMYRKILDHPGVEQYDFSPVRFCISGASALKPELLDTFEKKFSTTLIEGYGLCEATAVCTFNHLQRERRPGSIGTPAEGVEILLVDEDGARVPVGEIGEIIVRGDYLMKGYLNRPEATQAVMKDGWFHTGDLAYADEDGYLYIVDRKTDMIVKGGFNIYPVEVEELLLSHPAIAEAAVIAVPDPVQGEEVKACIVLKEEAELDAAELASYCRERMARYKCPRYIQFYRQLPKSPSGRILKKKLRGAPEDSSARD